MLGYFISAKIGWGVVNMTGLSVFNVVSVEYFEFVEKIESIYSFKTLSSWCAGHQKQYGVLEFIGIGKHVSDVMSTAIFNLIKNYAFEM